MHGIKTQQRGHKLALDCRLVSAFGLINPKHFEQSCSKKQLLMLPGQEQLCSPSLACGRRTLCPETLQANPLQGLRPAGSKPGSANGPMATQAPTVHLVCEREMGSNPKQELYCVIVKK